MSTQQSSHSGLSLKTLLIAGVASAVAALVIPMIWRPGTVFAAAMTPIIVALVTELLKKPVDTVGAVRVRRTARGAAILDPPPREPFDPLALPPADDADEPDQRRRSLTGRQWKLILLTGLVAFAAAAVVITASEVIAGDRVSGGGGSSSGGDSGGTTFFGGGSASTDEKEDATQDEEQSEEDATPTPTPEATEDPAQPTPTETPAAEPTAEPTAAPPAEEPEAVPPAEPTPAPAP